MTASSENQFSFLSYSRSFILLNYQRVSGLNQFSITYVHEIMKMEVLCDQVQIRRTKQLCSCSFFTLLRSCVFMIGSTFTKHLDLLPTFSINWCFIDILWAVGDSKYFRILLFQDYHHRMYTRWFVLHSLFYRSIFFTCYYGFPTGSIFTESSITANATLPPDLMALWIL